MDENIKNSDAKRNQSNKSKILVLCISVAMIICLYVCMYNFPILCYQLRGQSMHKNNFSYDWTNDNILVAHAFGAVEDKTYSNSLEAFEKNYARGHRVFEVDLSLTSDGYLVAIHDWSASLQKQLQLDITEDKLGKPLTLNKFKSLKIYKKFTPLSFEDIANLMLKHKDVYIITDTKETTDPKITSQFTALVNTAKKVDQSVLDRVIPQIYNEPMLDIIMKVYKFRSVIYTLYNRGNFSEDDTINFAYSNGIKVITTYERRYSDRFVKELKNRGIMIYMHTFNSLSQVIKYREKGVHGFYTDYIFP